jgi:hypothetical protein
MSLSLHVKSNDPAAEQVRREAAECVIREFGDELPDLRLLVFLDDEDCESLKSHFGRANRGFYTTLKGGWHLLPHYVQKSILVLEPPSWEVRKVADHLIYLYGGTCANRPALVMTFAHELQHFVQRGRNRELWAASTVLMNLEKDFYTRAGVKIFDIPIELEARVVAKRIATTLCGAKAVNEYIESRISEGVTPEDAEDWQFVRDLRAAQPFDLLAQSRETFQRLSPYRAQIEKALARAGEDADFKELDLSPLLLG